MLDSLDDGNKSVKTYVIITDTSSGTNTAFISLIIFKESTKSQASHCWANFQSEPTFPDAHVCMTGCTVLQDTQMVQTISGFQLHVLHRQIFINKHCYYTARGFL